MSATYSEIVQKKRLVCVHTYVYPGGEKKQ